MLIDATDKFLDRMAHTIANARLKGEVINFNDRFPLLNSSQRSTVNLRAALVARGIKKGS